MAPWSSHSPSGAQGEGWHEAGARFIIGSGGAAGDVKVKP